MITSYHGHHIEGNKEENVAWTDLVEVDPNRSHVFPNIIFTVFCSHKFEEKKSFERHLCKPVRRLSFMLIISFQRYDRETYLHICRHTTPMFVDFCRYMSINNTDTTQITHELTTLVEKKKTRSKRPITCRVTARVSG